MATAKRQIGDSGRAAVNSSSSQRRRVYIVSDASSVDDARATIVTELTNTLGPNLLLDGYPLLSIDITERAAVGVYEVVCTFGAIRQTVINEARTAFEFGQETDLRTYSIATQSYGNNPPNSGGAIGIDWSASEGTHVKGVHVPASAFSFSKTVVYPIASISDSFVATIAALDKHVNSDTFAGFQPGEVLFTGANGNQASEIEFEISYRFKMRPNETNLAIGGITIPFKKGWHHIDVLWKPKSEVASASLVPEARAVYVHQVLPESPLSALGI